MATPPHARSFLRLLSIQCVLSVQLCAPFTFTSVGKPRPSSLSSPTWPTKASINRIGGSDDNLPVEQRQQASAEDTRPSIHPATIDAIADALRVRARSESAMPLRYAEGVEQLDIHMAAGRIAQGAIARGGRAAEGEGTPLSELEKQTIGGRILAVIMRLEDQLEPELRARCKKIEGSASAGGLGSFGVLQDEDEAGVAAVDEKILEDDAFVANRAECLLALFLEELEGPGLRSNGIKVPCMDVDFLGTDRFEALFGSAQQQTQQQEREEKKKATEKLQEMLTEVEAKEKEEEEVPPPEKSEDRPSLHPVTIDAIAEALQIRAENKTTSPLRMLKDGTIEMLDVQLAARRIAEKAVEGARHEAISGDGTKFTEEEESAVACRIVATLLRMDDLEWELVHRCSQRSWISERDEHEAFGILKDETCVRTLDQRILSDMDFATKRAERLLALFLLNLEGPGVKAAGDSVPGGSEPDYLEEEHYKIMMPNVK